MRPNVVIVYTDQHRYDMLGSSGNPWIRTPSLDRFAAEGVQFTRGYATCPVCVPSRVGLFTGRYNHTNGSYNNSRLLRPREYDLAEWLKRQAGYATALIGKDHCFGAHRLPQAFDFVREAHHCGFAPPLNAAEQRVNAVRQHQMQVPFADNPLDPADDVTGGLFRSAREYVSERNGQEQPFFLWLSIPDPHPPYMVPEPYRSMYDAVELPPPAWVEGEMDAKPHRQRQVVEWDRYGVEYSGDRIDTLRRIYAGMVSYIDDEMGRFVDHLRDVGLDENTVVLFTADHGDYMGDHRMIRKGPHVYEALVHVPLLARFPGQFPPRPTDAMVTNIDICPTICDLVGIAPPEGVQGRSFAPVLRGHADAHHQRVFLEHGDPGRPLQPGELSPEECERLRHDTGHHLCPTVSRGPVKGVRSDRWKYVYNAGDVDELYDLHTDPHELRNLAADPALRPVVDEHRQALLEWLIDTEDTLAADRTGG